MKKSIKTLITAILVLILLGGGYFLAVKWEPEKQEEEEKIPQSKTEYILNEELENIEYIQFNTGEISYIIRNGEKPTIEGYKSYVIDEDELTNALYNVSSVAISHKVSNKEELSVYGLDKEGKSLVIKLKDGKERKMLLGNSANFDGEYYAKLSDSDDIYTIASYEVSAILKNPDQYRSLDICTIDNKDVKEITIKKGNSTLISVYYDEERSNNEVGMPNYRMTLPYKDITVSADKVNMLLEKLTSLSATKIVYEGTENLSSYGLENPYTLILKGENQDISIKMGSFSENGEVYIMKGDVPTVYSASCPFYEIVKATNAEEYIDRFIHIFNIEKVKEIKISSDSQKHVLGIEKKGEDSYKYTVNSKHIVEENFKKLYQSIIGVVSAQFSFDNISGKEKCTIEFSFTDGTKKRFKYYIYDERYCIVKADNGMTCLTLTKNIDQIFENLK